MIIFDARHKIYILDRKKNVFFVIKNVMQMIILLLILNLNRKKNFNGAI